MWWRSPSFILDKQQQLHPYDNLSTLSHPPPPSMSETSAQNPNPKISAYNQTRAAHHGVVTSERLSQEEDSGKPQAPEEEDDSGGGDKCGQSVVDEFNSWRKQPDLAEAVAAIRALASVIRSSKATTMMELWRPFF